MANVAVQIRG